jgi:hypothetical protein
LNGYLQRLVLSTRNPGGSIRPMLGSIFAAPQYRRTPKTVEVEEEAVSRGRSESLVAPLLDTPRVFENPKPERARPESFVTPLADTPRIFENPKPETAPPASGIPPLQTHTLVPGRAAQSEDFNPISEETSSFKPLVARAQQEEIEKPAVRFTGIVEPAETLARGEVSVHPQPARERTDHDVVFRAPFRPLMAEKLQRTEPQKTFPDASSPLASNAGREEKRDLSRRLGMPAREPDEIQIHIGRIEVTALPPAPVRPAPKPAHKSLDLGAYLKRRGGSA